MKSKDLFYSSVKSGFNKTITVPTSKSFANRIIILAALKNTPVKISNLPASTDVKMMLSLLEQVGLEIEYINASEVVIKNSFPECEIKSDDPIDLLSGDGGTTNRFIIPLLSLGENVYKITPAEKMFERPMDELEKCLKELGVEVTRSENIWFQVKGPALKKKSSLVIDSSRSTQFATGAALSFSSLGVNVDVKDLHSSAPYWEMTKDLIKRVNTENEFDVPVDASSLGYPLALAAVCGEVRVVNAKKVDIYQADFEMLKVLEKSGFSYTMNDEGLRIKTKNGHGYEHDCKNCPDLVPTLCFLSAYLEGETKLKNIEVLKYKECDRLAEMLNMLKAFKVEHQYDEKEDELIIKGGKSLDEAIDYEPPNDHRMIMVAHLFQRVNGGGKLYNYNHVKKSFPDFFEVMN